MQLDTGSDLVRGAGKNLLLFLFRFRTILLCSLPFLPLCFHSFTAFLRHFFLLACFLSFIATPSPSFFFPFLLCLPFFLACLPSFLSFPSLRSPPPCLLRASLPSLSFSGFPFPFDSLPWFDGWSKGLTAWWTLFSKGRGLTVWTMLLFKGPAVWRFNNLINA